MEKFRETDWIFLNANSPADLFAEYSHSGSVTLREYAGNRNGHLLVSDFFCNDNNLSIETEISYADDGAAVGFYYGDGCYTDYIEICVNRTRLSVHIPGGAPLGDTFRYDGTERTVEIAATECTEGFPLRLKAEKHNRMCKVSVNNREMLNCHLPVNTNMSWTRIYFRAVNNDFSNSTKAVFNKYELYGRMSRSISRGRLIDKRGFALTDKIIHLCAFKDKWTKTDGDGNYEFRDLAPGEYDAVCGAEGEEYTRLKIKNTGNRLEILDMQKERTPQKEIYDDIKSDAEIIPLNGIWSFDWDSQDCGEREQWYLPEQLCLSKVIRVPYSFHSLEAFGEEFLVDGSTGHEAASWYVNMKETGQIVWYRRTVNTAGPGRWELVLRAVSGMAKVWINGNLVGCTVDSYETFRFPVSISKAGEALCIVIRVEYIPNDNRACRGKQDFWFHAAPGIWQNVYLEKTDDAKAKDILIKYNIDEDKAEVSGNIFIDVAGESICNSLIQYRKNKRNAEYKLPEDLTGIYKVTVWYRTEYTDLLQFYEADRLLCTKEVDAVGDMRYFDKTAIYVSLSSGQNLICQWQKEGFEPIRLELEKVELPEKTEVSFLDQSREGDVILTDDGRVASEFEFAAQKVSLWSPESPMMYEIKASLILKNGKRLNFARTAGFRNVESDKYIQINKENIYIRGVLDQGYNPWGIYTYPSDRGGRGTMQDDIFHAAKFGYNLIRMHIKDTEPLWYHMCDQTGMLVWDEHPVNFYAKWSDECWRSMYYRRLKDMIRKHNYHPSVILFSTFNESWGITGGHEMSPWEEPVAQSWQKECALYYKEHAGNVLVVDNSGYAKTDATDILDYHMYPDEYDDASVFFGRLEIVNFPGSCFNCYNENNRLLMNDADIRDLLQRNCSMDLEKLSYCGNEVQHGQPVIISEFVHTGRIDQLIRKYNGIAGYVRMNLASQENEDTSPLTSERILRKWGYRHADLSDAEYVYENGKHAVIPDFPVLSKMNAGDVADIPIFARIWENKKLECTFEVYECLIDVNGNENTPDIVYRNVYCIPEQEAVRLCNFKYAVPDHNRAVQLFFVLKNNQCIIAENDLRIEIFPRSESSLICHVNNPETVFSEGLYGSTGNRDGREAFYIKGRGWAEWIVHPDKLPDRNKQWVLRFEASSCECVNGTKVTDEIQYGGCATVELNGERKIKIDLEDAPWDELAVFSNCSGSKKGIVPYKCQGRYGYGVQIEILLNEREKKYVIDHNLLMLKIITDEAGIVLYGRRMGRYGSEPLIIERGEITK